IQITGDSEWYVLTYATTSTGTLSSAYAGTTDATATYQIVYPTVVFGASVGSILEVRRDGFGLLDVVGTKNSEMEFLTTTTGQPLRWCPYVYGGTTPDDAHRILLDPAPDAAYAFTYLYMRRPSLLAVDDAGTGKVALPSM